MSQSLNPFLYPGEGLRLRQATNGTAITPTAVFPVPLGDTGVYQIPTGQATESIGCFDALEVIITVKSTVVGAGPVNIYLSPTADTTKRVLQIAVDMTGSYVLTWSSETAIGGFISVENQSGVAVSVTLQKRIQ